jgi:hypothetical protein
MDPVSQENRFRGFAKFFKGYMGVMPIVTAAVAPFFTLARAIPVFDVQRTELALYSGLFGFLLVAYVFYAREVFVRSMFTGPMMSLSRCYMYLLPLALIIGSAVCYFEYNAHLDTTVYKLNTLSSGKVDRTMALQSAGVKFPLEHGVVLQIFYLGMFSAAEMAFVLMALREYALDKANISELDQLFPDRKTPGTKISLEERELASEP